MILECFEIILILLIVVLVEHVDQQITATQIPLKNKSKLSGREMTSKSSSWSRGCFTCWRCYEDIWPSVATVCIRSRYHRYSL